MNSLRLLIILSAAGALASAGCDPKAKCVADCDTSDIDDGSGSGSESGSPESGETTAVNACEAAAADAAAFIAANRQCETVADCVMVDGICFQGADQECGSVGLAADADLGEWDALHGALQGCECGANACGATLVCTAEGNCEAQFGTPEAECAIAENEVELFLADNRACEVDEDCQYVDKGCYDGPLAECVAISLNVDADLEVWDQLQEPLGMCGHDCFGNECGADVHCGDDGLCAATFP